MIYRVVEIPDLPVDSFICPKPSHIKDEMNSVFPFKRIANKHGQIASAVNNFDIIVFDDVMCFFVKQPQIIQSRDNWRRLMICQRYPGYWMIANFLVNDRSKLQESLFFLKSD